MGPIKSEDKNNQPAAFNWVVALEDSTQQQLLAEAAAITASGLLMMKHLLAVGV